MDLMDDDQYGLLPRMAVASKYTVGAQNAKSFSERVISAANLVMDDGSTALCDECLEMLVVLRINRKFMECMRTNHAGALHETLKLGSV